MSRRYSREQLTEWLARRLAAFQRAIEKNGPLTPENHRAIGRDTKRFEREAERADEAAEMEGKET